MELDKSRVATFFITGGAGAIGSMVARYLVEHNQKVIIYDKRADDVTLFRDISDNVTKIKNDIINLPALVQAMKENEADYVIHAAALVDPIGKYHPIEHIQNNLIGSMNVFEACRILDIPRVVYCSSRGVYKSEPSGETPRMINEDYPLKPLGNSLYAPSKLYVEYLAEIYNHHYNLECVGLRFAATFGPGKTFAKHGYHAIISKMIEDSIIGKPTVIPKGGNQRNDYVYYKDVARGLILACLAKNLRHKIFNIGSGEAISLFDIREAIRKIIPSAQIEIGPGLDFLGTGGYGYVFLDIRRARQELNYIPKFPIEKAVKDYIETVNLLGLPLIEGKHC